MLKIKLLRYLKYQNLILSLLIEKNIHFDKSNLSIKKPHKIMISNESLEKDYDIFK